jgi:RNA recognition motif-containing protein
LLLGCVSNPLLFVIDNLESTIQVKWSAKKRIFNEDQLRDIFSAFGKINLIGFPKNKRTTALISFASIAAAVSTTI